MISEFQKNYYKALDLATKAHDGQVDKAGKPYIQHVISVSERIWDKLYNPSFRTPEEEKFPWTLCTIALLHDTLEDSKISIDDLNALFDEEIVEAVIALTRKEDESYGNYIKRLSENELATYVKFYDLEDNLDLTRLEKISEKDIGRINKYLKWHRFLDKVIYERNQKN